MKLKILTVAAVAATAAAVIQGCFMVGPARPISEALSSCGRFRKRPDTDGNMKLVLVESAHGRCNDGSPPGMYVRKAPQGAHENDWVIYIEGGHACSTYNKCKERYCGTPKLMSSDPWGDQEQGNGILSTDAQNPFNDWNAVKMQYCTSDLWTGGQTKPVELTGVGPAFTVRFEGHQVIMDLLDALDAGAKPEGGGAMPSLRNAKRIVWAGSSAGGAGAMYNLDYAAGRYPNAKVVGAIDGWISPSPNQFPGGDQAKAQEYVDTFWSTSFQTVWNSYAQTECKSKANALDGEKMYESVVKTPAVIRVDERDPVISDGYLAAGIAMPSYSQAIEGTAKSIVNLGRPDLSIIVSNCAQHTTLMNEDVLYDLSVKDTQFLEAIDAMMTDGRKMVAIDSPTDPQSHCGRGGGGTRPGAGGGTSPREREREPEQAPRGGKAGGGGGGGGGKAGGRGR